MVYRDFENLTRKTASDKILLEKAFNIAKNSKYNGYQKGLALMIYKYFDKKHFSPAISKQKNYINQLLKNSKKENYHHLL